MKKMIYVLSVNDYAPEIRALTMPLIEKYAQKIGADVFTITERRWPEMPPVYEKLQIYYLGRKHANDWNIYIDADAVVHPDLFDVTEIISKDTVLHNGADMAGNRWTYDNYFRRDGRHIGSCNWFTVASDWCLDLWHPLDIPFEDALRNIHPILNELKTVITPEHLIDDYTLSRNIARYGLKFKTLIGIQKELSDPGNYLWHAYTLPVDEKVWQIKGVLTNWGIADYSAELKEHEQRIELAEPLDRSPYFKLPFTSEEIENAQVKDAK